MNEENIDINHEPREKVQEQFNRVLTAVGLQTQDLKGKTVLDAGSGRRFLERGARLLGIDTSIVSLDKNIVRLTKNEDPVGTGVVTDIYQGLPFQDEVFDTIINVGGPIHGGPYSEMSYNFYSESLRLLKPNGELRTTAPLFIDGINTVLYFENRDGNLEIPKEDIEKYLQYNNNANLDDRGVPDEYDDYWLGIYKSFLSKEQQVSLNQYLIEELVSGFKENGLSVNAELHDTGMFNFYNPYMVLKKHE